MVRIIRETVTVTPDHEVRLQDLSIPAGSRVEVVVVVDSGPTLTSERNDKSIWDVVSRSGGTRGGNEIIDELRRERDAWDSQ